MVPPDGPDSPGGEDDSGDGARDGLATAVRRLIAATVTSNGSPEELVAATARLAAVADDLERTVPADGGRLRTMGEHALTSDGTRSFGDGMAFDVIVGPCNPLAPPVVIELEPPRAIGHVTFTAPYEGAPGCVHGAVLAGAFDIVLTAANVLADAAGPTVSLSVRYLKPTVIGRPCRFEAWVVEADGRRTTSWGTLTQDGIVTVEAEGVFATISRERIASMHRQGDGRAGPASSPPPTG